MSSILEILDRSKSYLEKREIEKSRIIAETVVAEALQIDRIMIYAGFEREITEDEKALIRSKLASIVDKSDDEIDIGNFSFATFWRYILILFISSSFTSSL